MDKQASEKKNENFKPADDIPAFDLAQQIMAEQRRVTSGRRKAPTQDSPSQHTGREFEITSEALEQDSLSPVQPDPVLTDIVARELQKLRGQN